VVAAKNLYHGVIPFIESPAHANAPHVEIAASFSFLNFFEGLLRGYLKSVGPETRPPAFAQIRQLVHQVLPFGTPVVHDVYFASQLTSPGDMRRFSTGYGTVAPAAVPSWKSFLLFQKTQLELKVREVILGSIDGEHDSFDVFGELRCVASLNYLPDVTVRLPWLERFPQIACHFCVKSIGDRQIQFSPPAGISQLLLWRMPVDRTHPPVDGGYRVREDDGGLKFALTINVHPPVKSVNVQIPFGGRGALTKHAFQNPGGQLKLSKRPEPTLFWAAKVGENGSMTLSGDLNFEARRPADSEKLRAYVSFKSKKKSFSGITLEKEAVEINPAGNVVPTCELSYTVDGKRYVFWETPLTD
jgi:AP-5 complex subunit mu-1